VAFGIKAWRFKSWSLVWFSLASRIGVTKSCEMIWSLAGVMYRASLASLSYVFSLGSEMLAWLVGWLTQSLLAIVIHLDNALTDLDSQMVLNERIKTKPSMCKCWDRQEVLVARHLFWAVYIFYYSFFLLYPVKKNSTVNV